MEEEGTEEMDRDGEGTEENGQRKRTERMYGQENETVKSGHSGGVGYGRTDRKKEEETRLQREREADRCRNEVLQLLLHSR